MKFSGKEKISYKLFGMILTWETSVQAYIWVHTKKPQLEKNTL